MMMSFDSKFAFMSRLMIVIVGLVLDFMLDNGDLCLFG